MNALKIRLEEKKINQLTGLKKQIHHPPLGVFGISSIFIGEKKETKTKFKKSFPNWVIGVYPAGNSR